MQEVWKIIAQIQKTLLIFTIKLRISRSILNKTERMAANEKKPLSLRDVEKGIQFYKALALSNLLSGSGTRERVSASSFAV